MFFNGIAIFFYPYAIEGWWLNKIQEGNPILLLGHPRFLQNLMLTLQFALRSNYFFLPLYSADTVSFLRPFARRDANTRRPFFVAILSRKPCLFFLFLLEGWNVLFIVLYYFICFAQNLLLPFSLQN